MSCCLPPTAIRNGGWGKPAPHTSVFHERSISGRKVRGKAWHFSRWGALRSVLFSTVAILSINAAAAAQDTAITMQEQPLSDALRTVAQKTGESILFTPESVEGLKAPAINGTMNAQQAVSMLTVGTDLEWSRTAITG